MNINIIKTLYFKIYKCFNPYLLKTIRFLIKGIFIVFANKTLLYSILFLIFNMSI